MFEGCYNEEQAAKSKKDKPSGSKGVDPDKLRTLSG